MAAEWRRIAATLADATRRRVYAEIVLGSESSLSAKTRQKAIDSLLAAGLITADVDGYVAVENAFGNLLAASPVITRTGIDRFIRDGRIEQYPLKASDRLEVFAWARDQVLAERERISEKEIGRRLSALTGDVALLRRYLVDSGLVERDADGREYWRATPSQV